MRFIAIHAIHCYMVVLSRGGEVKGRTLILQALKNIGFGKGWLPFADLVNDTNALWSMTRMHNTVSKSHSVNDTNADWLMIQTPRHLLKDLVNDRYAIWSLAAMPFDL